jgi:hypothetical protein
VTLADVENAIRVEAKEWADARGLQFAWDNAAPRDPHAQATLVWAWRPAAAPEQLTDLQLRHVGVVEAEIFVPPAKGLLEALAHAESLQAQFAGRLFAGGETLAEVAIGGGRREGASYVLPVTLPWEYVERRVPRGAVGVHETPGAASAYQAFRQRWESLVRAPLSLRSFFDNSPAATEAPPWALVGWKLLEPIRIETSTLRVPGRALVALCHPAATGVQAANLAASTIERAFHQVTFRGVCFGTPSVTRVGRTPADTWQTNVRLPFHYDVRT